MARRDGRDDLPSDHFVRQFTGGPMGDRPSRVFGPLTRQRPDPADLLGRDPGGRPGARQVFQPLFDRQVLQRNRLEVDPPSSPQPHAIEREVKRARNLGVALALSGGQDDPSTGRNLLANMMPTH